MSKLSKKLLRAIAEGVVAVANSTAGEVAVWIPVREGGERSIVIPAYGSTELAPKHTDPLMLKRSRNLNTLLRKGAIHVK